MRRLALLGIPLAVLACISAGTSRAGSLQAPRVIVSLSFDDGKASQYAVRSLLASHGMQATFFVSSSGIGGSSAMSWQQLHNLASDGNEIGGHSLDHVDLTTVSIAEATRQVCDDRDALIAQGFSPVSFAYPYGAFNAAVEQVVEDCGYSSGRSVGGLWNACSGCAYAETIPPRDAYDTRSAGSPVASTPLSELQSYVTAAEQHGGGWVQMEFHQICDGCEEYSTPIATLTAFLDWLQPRAATGTVVQTIQEALGSEPPPVDTTAPVTSIACNGAPCASGAYATAVSVSLSAADAGSGVAATRYTIDGTDPTTTSPLYTAPFAVTKTTTIEYRSWDRSGNIETTHTQTITITPPPPPPPPSGGGSAGGGAAPDLALTVSASVPTVTMGDTVVYRLEVRLKNSTQTSGVTRAVVTDTLPVGVELVSTKVNRGSGCTGTSTLTCDLDFLSGDLVGVIEITVRVTSPGAQVNTATVKAPEPDPDFSNNTASVTLVGAPQLLPPPLAAPAASAPKLTQQRPTNGAVLRASRTGAFARVVTRVSIDRKATVTLIVRNTHTGTQLTLQPGSRLGATLLRRPAAIAKVATSTARTLVVEAMLPARQVVGGIAYQLVVTATGARGGTSRLTIRFRA